MTWSGSRTNATSRPRPVTRPKVTRAVLPERSVGRRDRRRGQAAHDGRRVDLPARRRHPAASSRRELIVTQALCEVCAVSEDDVRALAEEIESQPTVIALDPHTLGEVLGDVRTDRAGDRCQGRGRRPDPRERPPASIASGSPPRACAGPRVVALEWPGPAVRGRPLGPADDRVRRRRGRARLLRRALRGADLGDDRRRLARHRDRDAVWVRIPDRPPRGRDAPATRLARARRRRGRRRRRQRLLLAARTAPAARAWRRSRTSSIPSCSRSRRRRCSPSI